MRTELHVKRRQTEIDILAAELPIVFNLTRLPNEWDDDWIFLPIDNPDLLQDRADQNAPLDLSETGVPSDDFISGLDSLPEDISGRFPGGLRRETQSSVYPPPDAFAFYLPFHFFYPTWWGIYLLHEGVMKLADILSDLSGNKLARWQYGEAARIFLFGHEQFHHKVESFATRLEATHRFPLYTEPFAYWFECNYGTDDCLEEALANAHGWRRVEKAFRRHSALPVLKEAFDGYIPLCGPGYRWGLEFVSEKDFEDGRNQLAELNHAVQFSSDAGPRIWSSFPNAFHPFRTRNGRVNFLVHRDSNLAKRLRLSGRFFRYKDVKRQVEEVAGCTFIETKGSHVHFRAPHGGRVTIPRHGGDLKIGTLASIVRQTGVGLNVHEFMKAEPGRT
jgi:predicted RNA binding protein YcfA (HicA-like mRNA interferase family)